MRIPFGSLTVTDKTRRLLAQAVESGHLSQGQLVRQLEDQFSMLVQSPHAVAVSSGTDALMLALSCLYEFGAKRGDHVILPALSFAATGNAVLHAGFEPVFVDVRRETLNIDPDLIEQAITPRTRAILAVHLMGKPADMKRLNEIARARNLYVIEDAAEAHGAKYWGRNVGTLGDIAAFSLYVAHIITSVEGGMVTTSDPHLADVLRSLRSHGRRCTCRECGLPRGGTCRRRFADGADTRFEFDRIGYSAKMNELEAAVGLGGMENFHAVLSARRKNLLAMMDVVERFAPALRTITPEKYELLGPHALPIIVGESAQFTRDDLAMWLNEYSIDSRDLFRSMPTQCPGFAYLGHKSGAFPNAEYIGTHGLHVGCHQDIGDAEIEFFAQTLEAFVAAHQ